jgi:putative ABC transport system permease protein
MGLILSLLAIGVLISFKVIRFCDITVDGSITFGASTTAILLFHGCSPWLATFAGFLAGFLAGFVTGLLHTHFKVQELLSGILVMTALYSINLRVMGKSNIPLMNTPTIADAPEKLIQKMAGGETTNVFGWMVPVHDVAMLVTIGLLVVVVSLILYFYLLTNLGTAMRAAGENAQMIRAQGVDNRWMQVFGLAVSNGLVGLAGAVLAQYQGFADVQMGIGMMVWGLASIIIGEALVGKSARGPGLMIVGAIMGTLLFRLLIAIALRWGLDPNDLKLVTALFVFAALVVPNMAGTIGETIRSKFFGGHRNA